MFMAALGPHWCARTFSSCGEWGLLSSCGADFSLKWSSCCRAWALGARGLVAVFLSSGVLLSGTQA